MSNYDLTRATHTWSVVWCFALMFACSSHGGGQDPDATRGDAGDGAPSLEPSNTGIALRVDDARGRDQVEVAFTLANGPNAKPLLIASSLFAVKLDTGSLIEPSVTLSPVWLRQQPCPLNTMVPAGGSISCVLVFEAGLPVTELWYRTAAEIAGVGDDQRKAVAPLHVPPCVLCTDSCTYLDIDIDNCGACGVVTPLGATCEHGVVTCAKPGTTACTDAHTGYVQCVDLTTDPANCGACNVEVKSKLGAGMCMNGTPTCSADTTVCDGACVSTQTDDRCGSCDIQCDVSHSCTAFQQSYLCSQTTYNPYSPSSDDPIYGGKDAISCEDICEHYERDSPNTCIEATSVTYTCPNDAGLPLGIPVEAGCADIMPVRKPATVDYPSGCTLASMTCTCKQPH